MNKDAYYFPHFCNARNDRKIRRVRKELGIEGYGIYFMILEILREQKDFRYPMRDIDLLADEIRTSEQKVQVVVTNYDLFKVDENEQFFSPKFLEYLSPYLETKQRNRINGIKGNLIKWGYAQKHELDELSDEEIVRLNENKGDLSGGDSGGGRELSQSKVKKSKVNQSKLYEPPSKSDLIEYFSERGDMIESDIPLEAENFINHYEEREWKNSSGKKITEWKRQAGTWNNNYQKFNSKRLQQIEVQPSYYQEL